MATKLRDLIVKEVSLVDRPANPAARVLLFKRADDVAEKAEWTTAYMNDLPDSAFAHISPGGEKDAEGRTVPRNLRHLPYRGKDGTIDPAHTRNALARLDQTDIPAADKAAARRKLMTAAREVGIEVTEKIAKQDIVACMRMCLDCCSQCLAAIASGTADADDLQRCCQMCCTCCLCCLAAMETAPAGMQQMEMHLRALAQEAGAVAKAGKRISAASGAKIKAALDALHALMGDMEAEAPGMPGKTEKRSGNVKVFDLIKAAFQQAGLDPEKEVPAGAPAGTPAAPPPDPRLDAITKQLGDLSKALTSAQAENADLKKRLDAAAERQAIQDFESRAAQYPLYPGSTTEKAGLLRKAFAAGEEAGKALEQSMAAVNAQLSKNNALLTELGRVQAPQDPQGPEAQLERMAKELVAKSTNLTFAQAYDAVSRTPEGNELLKQALKKGGTN